MKIVTIRDAPQNINLPVIDCDHHFGLFTISVCLCGKKDAPLTILSGEGIGEEKDAAFFETRKRLENDVSTVRKIIFFISPSF